jgi:hypothetical protein
MTLSFRFWAENVKGRIEFRLLGRNRTLSNTIKRARIRVAANVIKGRRTGRTYASLSLVCESGANLK